MEKEGGREGFWSCGSFEPALCVLQLRAGGSVSLVSIGLFPGHLGTVTSFQSEDSGVQPLLQNLYQIERCYMIGETWMLGQLMV